MPNIGPAELVMIPVVLAVVIAPIVLVALYAQRKGYSYPLFAAMGILVTWPLTLLIALLMPNRTPGAAHQSR